MNSDNEQWVIKVYLGHGLKTLGRTKESMNNETKGNDYRIKRDYDEEHEWVPAVRDVILKNEGEVHIEEVEISRSRADIPKMTEDTSSKEPIINSISKKPALDSVFGGTEIQVVDFLVASWATFGGIKGVKEFVSLLKEINTLAPEQNIEIIIAGKTKIKVSNKKDLAAAIAAIKQMEAED